ncbi:MAG: serine/threonine-protein kinase, partial [Planctomycetia bacterium]|nr:serine/threonine-protein kinase [Planctomycetia bacterium]
SSVVIPEDSPGVVAARIASLFQIGTRIRQFEILREIGGGGMGRVFQAMDTDLERLVALKVLTADPMTREARLRFHQEARSAARLNHRNIAQVWQYGEHEGIPYIVFEYVHGENIRSIVQRNRNENHGPMAFDRVLGYAVQITGALIHARHYDVVHRDIKPSNILVTGEGYVKLIDLGLARVSNDLTPERDLTISGTMLGTFDYIAPEQAADARVADCRSDIYSLGCTLFFMLTGQPPFKGTSVQKLFKHRDVEAPDVRELRPDLPADAARLLGRMMAKSPASRFQTPEDLLTALTTLVDDNTLILDMPTDQFLPTPQAPWKRLLERHLPWIIPTLVVILTAFVLQWMDRTVVVAPEELSPSESYPLATSEDAGSGYSVPTSSQTEPFPPSSSSISPSSLPPTSPVSPTPSPITSPVDSSLRQDVPQNVDPVEPTDFRNELPSPVIPQLVPPPSFPRFHSSSVQISPTPATSRFDLPSVSTSTSGSTSTSTLPLPVAEAVSFPDSGITSSEKSGLGIGGPKNPVITPHGS